MSKLMAPPAPFMPPVDLLRATRLFYWKVVVESRALQAAIEEQLAKATTVNGDGGEPVLSQDDWEAWRKHLSDLKSAGDSAMRRVQALNDHFPLCDNASAELAADITATDLDLRYIRRVVEAGGEATPQDVSSAKGSLTSLILANRRAFG